MAQRLEILSRVAELLRANPRAITEIDVQAVREGTGVSARYAYALLLASLCGLDAAGSDKEAELFRHCFLPMVCALKPEAYEREPYALRLGAARAQSGAFKLCELNYAPYEAFVCGELFIGEGGFALPRIGFFEREYRYPALMENDTLWMSVTPNEVETMREPLARAHGRVAAYGLGMGYYALTALQKPEVESVTVVERDENVISLFKRHILPRFDVADRLEIVRGDALKYAREQAPERRFDCIFADLWHDAGDGIPLYKRLKALEKPEMLSAGTRFDYWIEPSMKVYIELGVGCER